MKDVTPEIQSDSVVPATNEQPATKRNSIAIIGAFNWALIDKSERRICAFQTADKHVFCNYCACFDLQKHSSIM